ncbi:MAG: hypothetical protein KatS3mg051_2307 [Anaerolineae bacterium]|nr:MAG: hypothetical protein KatS3mg051_2307 [Anaerolineae bacterium]
MTHRYYIRRPHEPLGSRPVHRSVVWLQRAVESLCVPPLARTPWIELVEIAPDGTHTVVAVWDVYRRQWVEPLPAVAFDK